MAIRLLKSKCWVVTKKAGDHTYLFCQSKLRGIKCPLDGTPGKKAFILSDECFRPICAECLDGEGDK